MKNYIILYKWLIEFHLWMYVYDLFNQSLNDGHLSYFYFIIIGNDCYDE